MDPAAAPRQRDGRVALFHHEVNQGKGAALRTGFTHASSDIVITQDADLEYDPEEYCWLLEPILRGKADVVYGSRFRGGPALPAFCTTGIRLAMAFSPRFPIWPPT